MPRIAKEKPILSILDPEYDRWAVGLRDFYCMNPQCPESEWPSGGYRLLDALHFTDQGRCIHRKPRV